PPTFITARASRPEPISTALLAPIACTSSRTFASRPGTAAGGSAFAMESAATRPVTRGHTLEGEGHVTQDRNARFGWTHVRAGRRVRAGSPGFGTRGSDLY